jgi:glutathione S-transferase
MKIWGHKNGGNPVKVSIFLEEKGVEIPFEPIDLMTGEQRKPEFLARNPAAQVPVLELDDGTCISETTAICRYFERLFPEPALMGRTGLEEATIEMWQRRIELGLYSAARAVFRHSMPFAKALEPIQLADWAELNRPRIVTGLEMLEPQLAEHRFIAGPDFTAADITAVLPFQMIGMLGVEVPNHCPSVARWRADIMERPSVAAIMTPPPTES